MFNLLKLFSFPSNKIRKKTYAFDKVGELPYKEARAKIIKHCKSLLDDGEFDEAITFSTRMRDNEYLSEVDYIYLRSLGLYRAQKYFELVNYVDENYELIDANANVLHMLSVGLFRQHESTRALKEIDNVLKLKKAPSYSLLKGRILSQSKSSSELLIHLNEPFDNIKQEKNRLSLRFRALIKIKEVDKLKHELDKSVEFFSKKERDDYLLKGMFTANEYDDIISLYSNKRINTLEFKQIIYLAKSYSVMKKYDLSSALYEQAIKMKLSFVQKAEIAFSCGFLGKAEDFYIENYKSNKEAIPLARFYYSNRFWGKFVELCNQEESITKTLEKEYKQVIKCISLYKGNQWNGAFIEGGEISSDFRSSEAMAELIVNKVKGYYNGYRRLNVDSKLNVAVVIGSLGPGGAERQCVNLINGLIDLYSDKLEKLTLLCTNLSRSNKDRFYQDLVSDKIEVVEYLDRTRKMIPNNLLPANGYSEFIEHIQPVSRQQNMLFLIKTLDDLKPDVVHAWLDETIVNTVLAASIVGVPKIVGRWGSLPPGTNRTCSETDSHKLAYLHHCYKLFPMLTNDIVYSSNSNVLSSAYAEVMSICSSKVNTIYNGINFNDAVEDCPDINKIRQMHPSRKKVIGTVIRFTEEKQPFLWIDIAKKLNEQNSMLYFVMVGDGPLLNKVKEYSRLKGVQNIFFAGHQKNVSKWYKLFDLLYMTSSVEGVSNVVIESQYYGVPVVVPDVGGLAEAMLDKKTGSLIEKHSVDDYISSITEILNRDKVYKKISSNAVAFSKERFHLNQMVKNTFDIYVC